MITVGVDLGGTNLRAAILDETDALSPVFKTRPADTSPTSVRDAIVRAVDEVLAASGRDRADVAALCIGLAGQIDRAAGLVAVGPNLGWRDVPFGEMLRDAFAFPVRLENDLSVAAWGELVAGAGRGVSHLALVAVGSGVGCGLVEAGRLVDGVTGLAGELGHVKVVPGGEPCGCGEVGCLEAYVGGHRMAIRARRLADAAGASGLPSGTLTAEILRDAFAAGEPVATRVLTEAGDHLGLAVANLVTLLNPKRVVLGGGVLLGMPYLVDRVRDGIDRYAARPAHRHVDVALAVLGDDAGVHGAAHLGRLPA